MKHHMMYERRRIGRKHGEVVAPAESAAEIGSRVFPLQTPTEAMLTFARKSSTRVFMPRKTSYSTRVLRSGKHLQLDDPVGKEYVSGDLTHVRWFQKSEKRERRLVGIGKTFENVYRRKRRKIPSVGSIGADPSSSDRRFMFVFSRKAKKKKRKLMNGFGEVRGGRFVEAEDFFAAGVRSDCSQIRLFDSKLLDRINISRREFWDSYSDPIVLVVLLEFSCGDILLRFQRFLISVINWMMKTTRASLYHLTAFLLSEPISSIFQRRGMHLLPIADRNSKFLHGNSISNLGTCMIYSTREPLPLLSMNFYSLPSYFMSLHLAFLLSSQYLPHSLSKYLAGLNKKPNQKTECDDHVFPVHMDADFSGNSLSVSASSAANRKALGAVEKSALVARSGGMVRSSKLRKLQRRRSFLGQSRVQKFSSVESNSMLCPPENGARALVDPLNVRNLESFDEAFVSSTDKVISNSSGCHLKLMEASRRSHGEQMKEIKAALSDLKHNIDSVQCNVNILVTSSDRCWREEGAEVLLELSSSGDWCLAVKIGGSLRYLHRPIDMKYTLNRFNHAYMWIGDDGWRLEFCEKWDWLTFKELHAECRQRNNHPKEDLSVKIIPVPVFNDVPAYEDDNGSGFERPEQYIRMKHDDEILRAIVSEIPYYDMDSGDDEWLKQHNSSSSSCLLEDTFERMIFTFEKNAYNSSSNITSLEREPNNHEQLGTTEMMAGVYDYWLKKRKLKHAPLVRVFQGLSLRKPQLMQRPVLRKRRSLKKIRNQVGRGKPAFGFDSKAKEEAKAEALLKVEETEQAWRQSVEAAIPLRRRAQLLMENADLRAYKSLIAVMISEAKAASSSSSILDSFLPEI